MLKCLYILWLYAFLLAGCSTENPQPSSQGLETPAANDKLEIRITSFSDYDNTVVNRVSKQWSDLLDSGQFKVNETGKVVILFHINSDGTVSDVRITENNTGDLLGYACVKAIQNSSPFPKWPPEMIKKLGTHVDVQFTFDYDKSPQKSPFRSLFN